MDTTYPNISISCNNMASEKSHKMYIKFGGVYKAEDYGRQELDKAVATSINWLYLAVDRLLQDGWLWVCHGEDGVTLENFFGAITSSSISVDGILQMRMTSRAAPVKGNQRVPIVTSQTFFCLKDEDRPGLKIWYQSMSF